MLVAPSKTNFFNFLRKYCFFSPKKQLNEKIFKTLFSIQKGYVHFSDKTLLSPRKWGPPTPKKGSSKSLRSRQVCVTNKLVDVRKYRSLGAVLASEIFFLVVTAVPIL